MTLPGDTPSGKTSKLRPRQYSAYEGDGLACTSGNPSAHKGSTASTAQGAVMASFFNFGSQADTPTRKQHMRRNSSSSPSLFSVTAWPSRSMLCSLLLWTTLILVFMVSLSMLIPASRPLGTSLRMRSLYEEAKEAAASLLSQTDTVVIYTYSRTDPEYERNLQYFVEHGMWEGDGCDYIIIVQQDKGLFDSSTLPALPRNARYVFHENRCYDWGTFGWAIAEGKVDTAKYRAFVFMNSSVRGPFLPAYFPAGLHWSRVLTLRLGPQVKLVGSTISCEPAWEGADTSRTKRQNPHVQSYVMATDQVGLKLLREDGRVFACHSAIADTIYHAEVGASAVILGANYTLDSLMLKYQGVDWADHDNWNCNAGLNPYAEYAYDGLALNPLEVMFVKVKGFQLQAEWASAQLASTYQRWLSSHGVPGGANENVYNKRPMPFRLGKALTMAMRGPACFDYQEYRARNHDLPTEAPEADLWAHFVHDGQFEGRPFRFTCDNPLQNQELAEHAFRDARAAISTLPAAAAGDLADPSAHAAS